MVPRRSGDRLSMCLSGPAPGQFMLMTMLKRPRYRTSVVCAGLVLESLLGDGLASTSSAGLALAMTMKIEN
jgi:hypothetical protein